jgi:hypothetical protein
VRLQQQPSALGMGEHVLVVVGVSVVVVVVVAAAASVHVELLEKVEWTLVLVSKVLEKQMPPVRIEVQAWECDSVLESDEGDLYLSVWEL